MSTIIGFTGTRLGMTAPQLVSLDHVLKDLEPFFSVHHGGCKGSDEQFHKQITHDYPSVLRVIHWGDREAWRSDHAIGDLEHDPKPNLERNHDIVHQSDLLIAAPDSMTEMIHSGTWATVRYARKLGKKIILIFPQGVIKVEPARKNSQGEE